MRTYGTHHCDHLSKGRRGEINPSPCLGAERGKRWLKGQGRRFGHPARDHHQLAPAKVGPWARPCLFRRSFCNRRPSARFRCRAYRPSDLVVQPTGASLDDLEPAILVFHELVKKGILKDRLLFALNRVGTEAEYQDCLEYLSQTGYKALDGCIFEKPAYRQAQNSGFSILETRYGSLNARADQLIQSLVDSL